jgi:hypothetical protein
MLIKNREFQRQNALDSLGFNIVSGLIKTMPTLRDWITRATD